MSNSNGTNTAMVVDNANATSNSGNGKKSTRWDKTASSANQSNKQGDKRKCSSSKETPPANKRLALLANPASSVSTTDTSAHTSTSATDSGVATALEQRICFLEDKMESLTGRVDADSDYLRNCSLIFHGIPEHANEPSTNRYSTWTRDTMVEFINTNIVPEVPSLPPLTPEVISSCNRLRSSRAPPRPVIVTFTHSYMANLIITNGKALRDYNTKNDLKISIRRHHDKSKLNKIKYLNLCRKLVPDLVPGAKAIINEFPCEPRLKITLPNNELVEFGVRNTQQRYVDVLGIYDPNSNYELPA